MSYALIANTSAASADTNGATTGTINTSGASLLIIAISDLQSSPVNPAGDSNSNIWVPLTAQESGAVRTLIYYAENPVVGSGHYFFADEISSSFPSIAVAAFSGADVSAPFDDENGAIGAGITTLQPGSVVPSENFELVVTAMGQYVVGATVSIDSGYTITNQVPFGSGVNLGLALAYLIQTNAGSTNPTWTISATATAAAVIATFKSDGIPPSTVSATNRLALLGVGN